ncbi:hypothetical protein K3725_21280 (plasmid) [Leisingera sp. S132]|uniref:hypothetical protein n=1 Tax=Leisingera sp. S132 TaxID=2867016 RepID=UPI0021A76AE3|nr:hypothetical protein [Leisingera sp. S132]UWQ81762.1 hypothetical protein K3725_21280 [Leisingera sp. S132]
MGIPVDPVFHRAKAKAAARRRRRLAARLSAGGAVLAAVAAAAVFWAQNRGIESDASLTMMPQSEAAAAEPARRQAQNRAMLNLRRAPMLLRLKEEGQGGRRRPLPGPPGFLPGRAGPPGPARLSVVQDDLFAAGQQLMVHLPSARDDFALFQAHRRRALPAAEEPGTAREALAGLREAASAAVVSAAQARVYLFRETVLRLSASQTLSGLLEDHGFTRQEAEEIGAAAQRLLKLDGALAPGSLVALRWRPRPFGQAGRQLLQLSLYGPQRYLASMAQTGPGRFQAAADPWAGEDLLQMSGRKPLQAGPGQQPRLLDALYSTALRNGLATDLAGELIVMLSRRFDLERPVSGEDRLTLLLAANPGPDGQGAGQVLFAGIGGPSGQMRCYVMARSGPDSGFGCFSFAAGGGAAGMEAVDALVGRIVQVESAGRADAKNPLSTATGLGQFIEGTWLRMMRSYRPELAQGLARAELLALRLDPDLSREMVRNLARENEEYLQARGHQTSAGRLYLAHFLGAEGAHRALSSDPALGVGDVMGAAVVAANPFLEGKRIADLLAWADRKMQGRGKAAAVPADVLAYKAQIDAVLSGL